MLASLGVMSRLDVGLLALLVIIHLGFSTNGLMKGRSRSALDHGYDFGRMPFKSPPPPGPYPIALIVKLLAHVDICLHIHFTVRVGLLLPLWFVLPVVVIALIGWRRIVVDGITHDGAALERSPRVPAAQP